MLKRFLNGMVFGSGFALAFSIVSILVTQFFTGYQLDILENELASRKWDIPSGPINRVEDVVKEAPAFSPESEKFLGAFGSFSQGFTDIRGKVLAEGPGQIRGKVTANGEPAAGLKLRLALNRAVMSQWGVTDSDGVYTIAVPYGKYIIGGYELDDKSAHTVLTGLIDRWTYYSTEGHEFEVGANRPGEGLNLEYVDPVVKLTQGVTYTSGDDIVLAWQKYPGAAQYRVQLREKQSAGDRRFTNVLDNGGVDVVNATTLDLAPYWNLLKPGHYYTYDVDAVSAEGDTLSESAFDSSGYDFRIE